MIIASTNSANIISKPEITNITLQELSNTQHIKINTIDRVTILL
jgi:hypothetical protein